jgi:uncharacterized protein with HEPN domain
MPDTPPLILEIMLQIEEASKTIMERFEPVTTVDDLIETPRGREKLDAICMQLIAIGESLKKIDALTDRKLLCRYPEIDWKGVKGIRDVISHHYFDLDAEEIYNVCQWEMPRLVRTLRHIIEDLERNSDA